MKHWMFGFIGVSASGASMAIGSITELDPYVRIIAAILGCLVTMVTLFIQTGKWIEQLRTWRKSSR